MLSFFFFNDTATTEIYTLSLHDALPILHRLHAGQALDFGGHVVERLAVEPVSHADRNLREGVEHVELGDRERCEAVDAHGVTHDDGVEPPAAAGPSRRGAELPSQGAQAPRHRGPRLPPPP